MVSIVEILTSDTALTALRLSLLVATTAALISFVLGFPLAWVLVRSSFRGKTLVRVLVVLPLVMPPVVAGVGLLAAFGRRTGIVGSWLYEWFGIQLTFTTAAAVLAATFVSFPLAVLALEAGLRGLDERLEGAASTLGASRWYVLRRITFPLMGPQIAAALVLSWARALGEFGATITFAGNLQGPNPDAPARRVRAVADRPRGRFRGLDAADPDRVRGDPRASGTVPAMTLSVDVVAARGAFEVRATFEAAAGETVALLGPERLREVDTRLVHRRLAASG